MTGKEETFREAKQLVRGAIGRLLLGGICVCWAAAEAAGQTASVVEARLVMATDGARAGSSVKAAVVARVAPGYHINDHQPSLDYLIPTELKLDPSAKLSVAKVVYPKGELKRFAFSDTPLSVYTGTVEVGALLKVARATPPGEYMLKGKFHYQACNDHACLPPTSVPVVLTVRVVGRGMPLKAVNQDVFGKIKFD